MVCFEKEEILEILTVIDKELDKCGYDDILMMLKKRFTRALYDAEE